MHGKFDKDGKFIGAPGVKKVTHEGNKTIIERYSEEELNDMGFKKVVEEKGEGRPGPGMRPQFTHEDKGDHIVRTVNWVKWEKPQADGGK